MSDIDFFTESVVETGCVIKAHRVLLRPTKIFRLLLTLPSIP